MPIMRVLHQDSTIPPDLLGFRSILENLLGRWDAFGSQRLRTLHSSQDLPFSRTSYCSSVDILPKSGILDSLVCEQAEFVLQSFPKDTTHAAWINFIPFVYLSHDPLFEWDRELRHGRLEHPDIWRKLFTCATFIKVSFRSRDLSL